MTELHLHLDGSIRPETAFELARDMDLKNMPDNIEGFTSEMTAPSGGDLNAYLRRFEIPLQLIREREALKRIARELVCDLSAEGVDAAELRFAPHSSLGKGLNQRNACDAVLEGVEEGLQICPGTEIGIILCCMRGIDMHSNMETVHLAADHKGSRIRGVDLAGAEALYPTRDYLPLFREASALGLPFTIHAGEADGPESIRAALAVGAKRIGHGVRAIEDPSLMRELAERSVTLEACITSNIQTGICRTAAEHPIRRLFDAGVRVTISCDNRTISGTTLIKERKIAKQQLGFTDAELALMDTWAREAMFS